MGGVTICCCLHAHILPDPNNSKYMSRPTSEVWRLSGPLPVIPREFRFLLYATALRSVDSLRPQVRERHEPAEGRLDLHTVLPQLVA